MLLAVLVKRSHSAHYSAHFEKLCSLSAQSLWFLPTEIQHWIFLKTLNLPNGSEIVLICSIFQFGKNTEASAAPCILDLILLVQLDAVQAKRSDSARFLPKIQFSARILLNLANSARRSACFMWTGNKSAMSCLRTVGDNFSIRKSTIANVTLWRRPIHAYRRRMHGTTPLFSCSWMRFMRKSRILLDFCSKSNFRLTFCSI